MSFGGEREAGDGSGESGNDALQFRYNREKRLERAPEIVRETYLRGYTPNKGFIKGLTANAGLRSVLISIVVLCVAIVGMTLFADKPDTARFPEATARLKAFLYGDTVYVSVSFEPAAAAGEDGEPVSVIATIDGLDASGGAVVSQTVTGAWGGESYSLRCPLRDYELAKVRARVRFGESEAELVASVDRD